MAFNSAANVGDRAKNSPVVKVHPSIEAFTPLDKHSLQAKPCSRVNERSDKPDEKHRNQ